MEILKLHAGGYKDSLANLIKSHHLALEKVKTATLPFFEKQTKIKELKAKFEDDKVKLQKSLF